MHVLFDQGTPVGIRVALQAHVIKTAWEQGWSTLLNGDLLDQAEKAGFAVLLTTDKNLNYQQNLSNRNIAVVALSRNRWSLIRPMLQQIAAVVDAAKPGTYTLIEIPDR
ncbi:MAG TPA: hypothetical protein VFL42_10295 [Terriglobales bacterium]|nr:hypothetical protein [Terriglobales bacterium]